MISWLHTADLHLGKPIDNWKGSKEEYQKRKEEYRETFERIISVTKEKKVPFLFISGDFLEHGYVSNSLWDFILEQFHRISDTQVFISPGNHDPYRADSVYAQKDWPAHVHVFQSQWQTFYFKEYDLQIVGKGFADFYEKKKDLPDIKPSSYQILVTHGDLMSKEKSSPYFPIVEEELIKLDFDYVALGHIHKPTTKILDNEKETYVRYPGTPEALTWKEIEERSITYGQINQGEKKIQFYPIQTRKYEKSIVQMQGESTKEQILSKIIDQISGFDKNDYCLVEISGLISPDLKIVDDFSWLIGELNKNSYKHVYLEDRSVPDFDIDHLKKKSIVIKEFVHIMEEKIERADEEKKKTLESALYKGLEALYWELAN